MLLSFPISGNFSMNLLMLYKEKGSPVSVTLHRVLYFIVSVLILLHLNLQNFHDFALKENAFGLDEQYFQRHDVHGVVPSALGIFGYASVPAVDHQLA